MRWASAVSDEPELETALSAAAARVLAGLGNARPDLVVAFTSAHHAAEDARVPDLIAQRFEPAVLVGCSAGGVIGGGREVEQRPGVSLTAAALPGVRLQPFHAEDERLPAFPAGDDTPHFVLLADPFTFAPEPFLRALDAAFPHGAKVGGLASGGSAPGGNALYLGRQLYRAGCVGVALSGDVAVDTIVAQGCRPIGEPMFVTRSDGNLLQELDGRRAVDVLQELYIRSDARDQDLFRHSVFLGVVMNEVQQEYRAGDFLIRNVTGMDAKSGMLSVGAMLREGLVVQFHLRDAKTSAEELEALLSRHAAGAPHPAGSLLFSCLGRGTFLYGKPDHDTDAVRRHLGEVPLGGFFCNGEIGPVQGTTFLHGYTSAFGLFRPR